MRDPRHVYQMPFQQLLLGILFFFNTEQGRPKADQVKHVQGL